MAAATEVPSTTTKDSTTHIANRASRGLPAPNSFETRMLTDVRTIIVRTTNHDRAQVVVIMVLNSPNYRAESKRYHVDSLSCVKAENFVQLVSNFRLLGYIIALLIL